MTPISSDEMRKIEQDAIRSGRVTGLELMERAGCGVVEAIYETWPHLAAGAPGAVSTSVHGRPSSIPKTGAVLCGPGNNGGDGFVVARLLAQQGWAVTVFFYGKVEKLPPDAYANYARWSEIGAVHALSDDSFGAYVDANPDVDVVIDALFGIGLSRPFTALRGVRRAVHGVQGKNGAEAAPFVVCLDIPSGLCAQRGTYLGCEQEGACITASLTVTFHLPKHGHVRKDGPTCCGKLVVKDIGLQALENPTTAGRRLLL